MNGLPGGVSNRLAPRRLRHAFLRRLARARTALARAAFHISDRLADRHGPHRRRVDLTLRAGSSFSPHSRLQPISWLDEYPPTARFLEAESSLAVGPNLDGNAPSETVTLPPVSLYALRDATVSTQSAAFACKQGLVIERVPSVDPTRCSFEGGAVLSHLQQVAEIPQQTSMSVDRAFFLGGYGYWNWYHWLVELLPKLAFWEKLDPDLRAYPFLVGEQVHAHPALLEALALFCPDAELIVKGDHQLCTVGHLLHVNSPNPSPFNLRGTNQMRVADFLMRPSAIHDWRKRAGLPLGPRDAGDRRLFLARAHDRRSYNQVEALDIFVAAGFEPVYFEQMSLREQVETMNSAQLIAGPTGAAWANLIFCNPGAKALCWIAEPYKHYSAYSTIAHIVGVDVRYFTYPTTAQSTAGLYEAPYRLDIAELERELFTLLAETSPRA